MASFPFPNKISQASTSTLDQKAFVSQYGDGYQQRAAVGINNQFYRWDVQINYLSLADRAIMVSFWQAHGRVVSFDWTPPNGTAGKYVFVEPLVETSQGNVYSFSMVMQQVFE